LTSPRPRQMHNVCFKLASLIPIFGLLIISILVLFYLFIFFCNDSHLLLATHLV
jgi:hypothetical protein